MIDALPGHWNQKQELGGFDTTSKATWADCIRAAAAKGLRLTRGQGYYKLHMGPNLTFESQRLDEIMANIEAYQPKRAER